MSGLSDVILSEDLDLANKTTKVSELLEKNPELTKLESARCLKHSVRYGYNEILRLLLSYKVPVDVFDEAEGSVQPALYEISKDDGTHGWQWNSETVSILVNANPDISFDKGNHLRTPLHWAATQGHTTIVQRILEHVSLRFLRDQAQEYIDRTSYQEKTPLHLAAQNGHAEIVRLLVRYGVDVAAICTNDRTALHLAARVGSPEIIVMLLNAAPSEDFVNARTSDGATALHFASEEGHSKVVELLLRDDRSHKNPRDRRYWTPLLKASQQGHQETFDLFAPYLVKPSPSPEVELACESYSASVFDFYKEADETRISSFKCTVAELLYDQPPSHPGRLSIPTNVRDMIPSPGWRWVHLPSNNLAWVEALINRAIIERGSCNVEIFKQIYQTLDQQSRSMRIHSRQMKPGYQRFSRSKTSNPINETTGVSLKDDDDSPSSRTATSETPTQRDPGPGNDYAVLYLPYLHWDYYRKQRRLKEVVKHVRDTYKTEHAPDLLTPTKEEIMIRSYLKPTTNLHLRRTLDQYRYPAMSTEKRDRDQVVYRYQKREIREGRGPYKEPNIFVVDQLWVWVLDGFILTCFPETANDPLDLLQGIITDLKLSEEPVETEMYILTAITGRCLGFFERKIDQGVRYGRGLNFFEMFEESVGKLTVSATNLLEQFQIDVAYVTQWLQRRRRPKSVGDTDDMENTEDEDTGSSNKSTGAEMDTSFVNRLIDISKETQLNFECVDIDDELTTLSMVMEEQRTVIEQFLSSTSKLDYDIPVSKAEEQVQIIEQDLATIDRLKKQVKDVSGILNRLLELKPRHATAIEARFARDQAEDSARSGQVIMVFTVVTIIFMPLSFLAAFFAINVSTFPRDANDALPLGWVSKYLFGIGISVSVPLIVIAFAFGEMSLWTQRIKSLFSKTSRHKKVEEPVDDSPTRAATWKSEASMGAWLSVVPSGDTLHRRSTHKSSMPVNSPQQAIPDGDVV